MAERGDRDNRPDAPLSSDTEVLRRIPPNNVKNPSGRPNSWCFKPKKEENGLSVDVLEADNTPDNCILRASGTLGEDEEYGIVSLKVGDVRALGLDVMRDPLPDNPHHALIVGKFTDSKSKNLAGLGDRGWIKRPRPE